MRFMNSDYGKGYANFAKATSRRAAPNKPPSSVQQSVTSGGTSRRTGGNELPTAKQSTRGPLPKSTMGLEKRASVNNNTLKSKAQSFGVKAKSTLAKAGSFIAKNKVGVGLAAAGALGAGIGATALARKMRSDKGRKRGQYSK